MSDTPRTDKWLTEDIEALRVANYEFTQEIHGLREQRDVIMGRLSETHTRMTEAEKQRDRLAKEVENLRAAQIHTCHDRCQKPMCVMRRQRDRLAKALEIVRDAENDCHSDGFQTIPPAVRHEIDLALAAVKGEEPEDPHKYCRGGGGNNFHCGCKYDAQNHESYYP
jgi:chromosome segregation ATPase